ERLREDEMTVMSLSGSPLARHSVGDEGARGPLDRGLDVISALLEPAYGFRSLANFKKKFQPDFAPLWMIYPDATQIPAIAIALVRCYIPGLTLRSAAQLATSLRRSREAAGRRRGAGGARAAGHVTRWRPGAGAGPT
ncbi:phosphatidylglycerol lysyltransferase domain-containing protein, partial [uncultured Microbacterium sp.]|uniref:phosphatidylglycerol lysyltransferase domain-containing protein n=1 Tax=uncultured Microbacterium sp. TaxID=191216 RepID=UPI00374A5C21